jgi:uncharacterized protein YbjT (DUF2867 family)
MKQQESMPIPAERNTMKILVTGATGYIGGAAAKALVKRGYEVFSLARSEDSAGRLRLAGIPPVAGDFANKASLIRAVAEVDTIVSTASIGSLAGSAETFAQDRDAIRATLGGPWHRQQRRGDA